MSIKNFFDKTVTVRRLRTVSGNKKSFQSTATVDLHIQDLSREARQKQGILDEHAWIAYFDADSDFTLQAGDKITDGDGVDYKIIEIIKKNYSFGINQHIEVLLVEYNE